MATHDLTSLLEFRWSPQPKSQALVDELSADFRRRCPAAAALADRMKAQTGTRFNDWIDHIQAPRTQALVDRLWDAGYRRKPVQGATDHYINEGSTLPPIVLSRSSTMRIGIKVERVLDFLCATNVADHPMSLDDDVQGEPLAPLRRALVARADGAELWAIERHGYRGFELAPSDPRRTFLAMTHFEAFRRRQRLFPEDELGFDHIEILIDSAIADLGVDMTCDFFFAAEREYWQRRNRAALFQKSRQDRLGLGWANHDHHTYRSTRENFIRLIAIWEKLGFKKRERFYAGHEAGWGAQVMEQPVVGIVTFNDVDLSPDEVMTDFAHVELPRRDELGTVGLWCALHGEAVLQAGMHHLECVFEWQTLKDQMQKEGNIRTMDPFTTFPYLRQAFTEGEVWPVAEERIARLLDREQITPDQAKVFRAKGALGSHLENLERNDGYKGFNQQGVSEIISITDPRKQHVLLAGA
jgi:hypothetical protein